MADIRTCAEDWAVASAVAAFVGLVHLDRVPVSESLFARLNEIGWRVHDGHAWLPYRLQLPAWALMEAWKGVEEELTSNL
jgi:hypothetical protein